MHSITLGRAGVYRVLAGVVLAAVFGGLAGASVSLLSGHPPVMVGLSYSLAGICGVLAFLCQVLTSGRRLG